MFKSSPKVHGKKHLREGLAQKLEVLVDARGPIDQGGWLQREEEAVEAAKEVAMPLPPAGTAQLR